MSVKPEDSLAQGHEALARGAWREARAAFEAALASEETPEALEALGAAAWWLSDGPTVFDARARAYRLYRERGERCAAARVAVELAGDYVYFRGERAVANGWLRRAARLLEGLGVVPEFGWLKAVEADLAISGNDPESGRLAATEALAVGRALGLVDLEMMAVALEGLALVAAGRVEDGMPRLDEAAAAALSGEMRDLLAVAFTCCTLVTACWRARDFGRANEWCKRVEEFAMHRELPSLFGICRVQHASLLIWRGEWRVADGELRTAVKSLTKHPALKSEGLVRLAELRRRQGRLDEVPALLERAASDPHAVLEAAALALEQDEHEKTLRLAQRFLRQVPEENRPDQLAALDLMLRAEIARGNHGAARKALACIQAIVAATSSVPLRALACAAEGLIAAAQEEHEQACRAFEDAADLYGRSGAAFEQARARMELGRSLAALGRQADALAELRAAGEQLARLGAAREARRARGHLQALERRRERPLLSQREAEVLRLVAQGLSNKQIARRLTLSEYTAKRHVANILTKLDLPSRAAAAAHAARQGLL